MAGLLERVQPTPLEAEQIKAPLGAPWIPARDVHDFMMETFNVRGHGLTPGKFAQYSVDWIPQLGQWRVGYSGGGDIDYKAARTYGTKDRNPFQLLEACLNNAQIIALARYLREDFAGLPAWPDLEFKVAKLR